MQEPSALHTTLLKKSSPHEMKLHAIYQLNHPETLFILVLLLLAFLK